MKLNGIKFSMQIDIGSDVALIPWIFWGKMGKLKLRKSNFDLKEFNGSVIKTLGSFEGIFETKISYEIIPIIVVQYTKSNGLLGIYFLKVDTVKLINRIMPEAPDY